MTTVLDQELGKVSNYYYRLVWRLESEESPRFHLTSEVSKRLDTVHPRRHALMVGKVLDDLLREQGEGPVFVSGLDLLFRPELFQLPVGLLKKMARHHTLVVDWPGTYENGLLCYRGMGWHPEAPVVVG